jgi:hypothetical protein
MSRFHSTMVSILPLALGGASALLILICGFLVISQNAGSRNLVLAFSTLIGALVLLAINLWFELRPTDPEYTQISVNYTLDRAAPAIRQWKMPRGIRAAGETGASNSLADSAPQVLKSVGNLSSLATDLTMFSLLYMIGTQEFDWQLRKVIYQDENIKMGTAQGLSPPSQCTKFSADSIRAILAKSDNKFARAPLSPISNICLPPETTMGVLDGALLLQNPYCRISFRPQFVGMSSFHPDNPSGPQDLNPSLSDKQPQYLTVYARLDIETRFFALRAQSTNMAKYRAWANRIVSDAEDWWGQQNTLPLGVRVSSTNPEQDSR